MNRIRQGWDALRRGRRSGVSLVIALCAVAVLIGLSLSIVYSSSMLLSRIAETGYVPSSRWFSS